MFLITSVLICALSVSGCKSQQPKTFEKEGVRITATADFKQEGDNTLVLCVKSSDKLITCYRQPREETFPVSEKTLREYTEKHISDDEYLKTKKIEISAFSKSGVNLFDYFTYEKAVNGTHYSYLAVTKKGEADFYLFHFGCETKNFEKFMPQFLEWAKLLEIEKN